MGDAITGNSTWDTMRTTALSGDGTTLAVGAPGEWGRSIDRPGYANVYKVDSGSNQIGMNISGTFVGKNNSDLFGLSMSLSFDGNTLAIGAPRDFTLDVDGPGYVRVYQSDGNTFTPKWIQVGQDIQGEEGDYFGVSVSLSADGKTLAIGAFGFNSKSGRVRIYRIAGSNWMLLGNEIHAEAAHDECGWSVSLSADGMTVAIGATRNDGNGSGYAAGHVRVFRINDNEPIWRQLGNDIDGIVGYRVGTSVSISSDGDTIALGWPGDIWDADRTGYVRVYNYDEIVLGWKQIGLDIKGEGYGDVFGVVVSLSADGTTVAIAALAHNDEVVGVDAGQVKVFHYDSAYSTWSQQGQTIIGERAYDYSGSSISLSSDGQTLAIASQWNDDNGENSGHVRIFSIGQ